MRGLKKTYLAAQFLGWSTYILIALLLNSLRGEPLSKELFILLIYAFVIGIGLSHAYREVILRKKWLNLSIGAIIPRFLLGSLLFGFFFECLYLAASAVLYGGSHLNRIDLLAQELTGWVLLFLFWSVVYFFYHFFRNYKQEEIKNLRWEAARSEMELNRLKSQLNPHFIFNAMNSIRALVDEDAKKAKDAITRLSNILRSSLQMGRERLISLQEELKLVNDYLALETIRYEERLRIEIEIPADLLSEKIPPMLLQTLVENAIKHGIAKLPKGGLLRITGQRDKTSWKLEIQNPGKLNQSNTGNNGIGLENTRERLQLLFGATAELHIYEMEDNVCSVVKIPYNNQTE
jgi:sensor histidine kinase YesM